MCWHTSGSLQVLIVIKYKILVLKSEVPSFDIRHHPRPHEVLLQSDAKYDFISKCPKLLPT